MTQEQIDEIIEGQKTIINGINKLLALFILEPLNEATNPILGTAEAAKLLGVSKILLLNACKNNEVPFRKLGSKYLFSRVALLAWLHCINTSYLGEKVTTYNKYSPDPSWVNNWVKISINPTSGASEEYQVSYNEPKEEPVRIDIREAAKLLGVSLYKMGEWARGFLYYRIPVVRVNGKVMFNKVELIEWTKTPEFKKLMSEHEFYRSRQEEGQKQAKARREAERLEKEAKKKKLLEKKMHANKENT